MITKMDGTSWLRMTTWPTMNMMMEWLLGQRWVCWLWYWYDILPGVLQWPGRRWLWLWSCGVWWVFCELHGCPQTFQWAENVTWLLPCGCLRPQCCWFLQHGQSPMPPKGKDKKGKSKGRGKNLFKYNKPPMKPHDPKGRTQAAIGPQCLRCGSSTHKTAQCTQGTSKPTPKASPAGPNKRHATEGIAVTSMMDPENGMVIFEDQEGSQRPDCAMMDPGASSFLMGFGPLSRYIDHLKKLQFPVHEIVLKKANRTFHFGGDHKAISSWTVHLPIFVNHKFGLVQAFLLRGETPMLLGRPISKALGMAVDFLNDRIKFDGSEWRDITLGRHHEYLLPLTKDYDPSIIADGAAFDLVLENEDGPTPTSPCSIISNMLRMFSWLMKQHLLKEHLSWRASNWSHWIRQCWHAWKLQRPTSPRRSTTWKNVDPESFGRSTVGMGEPLILLHRLAWRFRCLDLKLIGISPWNLISEPSWTYWLKNFLTKCWCLQPVHPGFPCKMQTWRMNASANNVNSCENGITASTWIFAGKFTWSNSVKEDMLTWSSRYLHSHGGPVLSKTFQDIEPFFINVNMDVYVKTTMVYGDLCAKTPPFWLPRLRWHRLWTCYVLEITNTAVLKGTWKASEPWRLPSWRTTSLRWLPHWLLLWPHLRLHIPGTLDLQSRRSRSMLARWSTCMSRAKLKPCGLSKSFTATVAIPQPNLWLSCFKAAMPVKQWSKLQVPMFPLLANDTANQISLHLQTSLMSSASTRRFNPTSFRSKMARWSTPFCPTSTWPPSIKQQPCCGRRRPMTSSLVLKGLGLPT